MRHWSSMEIRVLPREDPVYPVHFMGALERLLRKTDFVPIEMRMAKRLCEKCSLCGEKVMPLLFSLHCKEKGDPNHLALEVLET